MQTLKVLLVDVFVGLACKAQRNRATLPFVLVYGLVFVQTRRSYWKRKDLDSPEAQSEMPHTLKGPRPCDIITGKRHLRRDQRQVLRECLLNMLDFKYAYCSRLVV